MLRQRTPNLRGCLEFGTVRGTCDVRAPRRRGRKPRRPESRPPIAVELKLVMSPHIGATRTCLPRVAVKLSGVARRSGRLRSERRRGMVDGGEIWLRRDWDLCANPIRRTLVR